ncbi:MAG: DUF4124 domain-containing protein [Rudaea sp.]
MHLAFAPIAVLIAFSANTAAETVYKCITPQGNVAFQDQPCPTGATQTQVWLPDAPPAPAQAAVATPAAPATDANPPPAAPVAKPLAPLPPLWVCENADDGSRYFSRNGNPPVRYVPLGVLGYPGQSLSQAYGPGGIGVSAPGLRQIPIDHSPSAAIAGDYTPLQDRCVRASRDQTCGWLQKQYDEVTRKLHYAFKDQQVILQPQADELVSQLNGC